MSDQPDYLQEVGKSPRIVMAILTGLFVILFGLMTVSCTMAAINFAIKKDYNLAMGLVLGAAASGLMTAFLYWLARRLYRGTRTKNELTVFPVWFVQVIGLVLIGPFSYITYQGLRTGDMDPTEISVILGPPVAMIILPWLIKRRRSSTSKAATE